MEGVISYKKKIINIRNISLFPQTVGGAVDGRALPQLPPAGGRCHSGPGKGHHHGEQIRIHRNSEGKGLLWYGLLIDTSVEAR